MKKAVLKHKWPSFHAKHRQYQYTSHRGCTHCLFFLKTTPLYNQGAWNICTAFDSAAEKSVSNEESLFVSDDPSCVDALSMEQTSTRNQLSHNTTILRNEYCRDKFYYFKKEFIKG